MTTRGREATALAEVGATLAGFGRLLCRVEADIDEDGYVRLIVRVKPEDQATTDGAIQAVGLYHEIERLADISQLRMLADKYDIPAEKLEALLPKEEA